MKKLHLTALIALGSLCLAGCGIKPNSVDAPSDAQGREDTFPRTYPDLSHDPQF